MGCQEFWSSLFRQHRKAAAFCLGVTGLVRLSIHQPLALSATQKHCGPLRVVVAQLSP
jgi:hypothetical protein